MEYQVETVSDATLEQAINLLADPELAREQIESSLCGSGISPQTALRLALFIPEAFGFILAGHMKEKIAPVDTFSVRKQDGQWRSVPYAAEPVFVMALGAAQAMFHSGPRNSYQAIASRSSVMNSIDNLLKQGGSLQGATMAIAFNGIPAELYPEVKRNLFEKFLDWRLKKLKQAADQG